jgi:hypothetical protein
MVDRRSHRSHAERRSGCYDIGTDECATKATSFNIDAEIIIIINPHPRFTIPHAVSGMRFAVPCSHGLLQMWSKTE